jgi:hypothetical protein
LLAAEETYCLSDCLCPGMPDVRLHWEFPPQVRGVEVPFLPLQKLASSKSTFYVGNDYNSGMPNLEWKNIQAKKSSSVTKSKFPPLGINVLIQAFEKTSLLLENSGGSIMMEKKLSDVLSFTKWTR